MTPAAGGGKDLVGRRIEIWWSKDKAFYPGVVKSYNHRKVTAAMWLLPFITSTMSAADANAAMNPYPCIDIYCAESKDDCTSTVVRTDAVHQLFVGFMCTLRASYSCCFIWHTDAVLCIQCAQYNQCTDMSTDSVICSHWAQHQWYTTLSLLYHAQLPSLSLLHRKLIWWCTTMEKSFLRT